MKTLIGFILLSYDIAEVVDSDFNVVARISKAALGAIPPLKRTDAQP